MLEKLILSIIAFFNILITSYDGDIGFAITPIIEPYATGEKTKEDHYLSIDYSNIDNGYIVITTKENAIEAMKIKITSDDKVMILPIEKGTHAYSLPFNSGHYEIEILKNVKNNNYQVIDTLKFEATFDDIEPYLIPNSVAKFSQESDLTLLSNQLCHKTKTDSEKVIAIYNWINKNIKYDTMKAKENLKWYAPDIDKVIKNRKGICIDQAALMVSMLRTQHIPAMIVEGKYEDQAHAWVKVFVNDKWKSLDVTMNIKNVDGDPRYVELKHY